jgi:hypothetical protein
VQIAATSVMMTSPCFSVGTFAHRVDGEIVGLQLLAFAQLDQLNIVGLADLLQHPQRNGRARRRGVIEREIGHENSCGRKDGRFEASIRDFARRNYEGRPRHFEGSASALAIRFGSLY